MNRDVVLVIYAGALGWCLHSWWLEEKERIAWRAAEKARDQMAFAAEMAQRSPEPDLEPAAGRT